MIKKVLFFLLFSFPLLLGCGSGEINGTVPIHLNLVFPASPLLKSAAPVSPAGVHTAHPTRLTLEVTGPGMSTISLSQEIPPSGEVIIALNILAGSARRFLIEAFDGKGNVIFRGESTVDIRPGGSPVVTVNLVAVPKPKPRFAYVANQRSNTVSIYTVNAVTGQLRANGYVTAGTASTTVLSATLDPLGRFVYVVNESTSTSSTSTPGTISTYTINPATGALTNTSATTTDGAFPSDATVDPSGRFVYVANEGNDTSTLGTISSYTINQVTGALTKSGTVFQNNGDSISPIFIDPLGRFAYEADGDDSSTSTPITFSTYTINPTTGTLTNTSAVSDIGINPSAAALHPSGQFAYVANESSSTSTPGTISTYTINPNAGAFTNIGTVATDVGKPSSAVVDPSGRFVYVVNEGTKGTSTPNTISSYTINPNGTLTTIVGTPVVAGLGQPSVTVDPSGKFVYVANGGSNDVSVYNIDPKSGVLTPTGEIRTQLGPGSIAISGGQSPVTYIPKFAYAANTQLTDNILPFKINPDGTLTPTGTPMTTGTSTSAITADPTGRFVYVANANDIFAYTVNAMSGDLTQIGTSTQGLNLSSITTGPTGRFLYAIQDECADACYVVLTFNIDSATGGITATGTPVDAGDTGRQMIIDPTGRFAYVPDGNSILIFNINLTTGEMGTTTPLTGVGQNIISVIVDPTGKFGYFIDITPGLEEFIVPFTINSLDGTLATGTPITVAQPVAMAIEPTGRFLYLVDSDGVNGSISVFQIDPASGALLLFDQPVPTGNGPESITIDASGRFVYVANNLGNSISTYTIDPTTGALTPIPLNVSAGAGPIGITTTGIIQ